MIEKNVCSSAAAGPKAELHSSDRRHDSLASDLSPVWTVMAVLPNFPDHNVLLANHPIQPDLERVLIGTLGLSLSETIRVFWSLNVRRRHPVKQLFWDLSRECLNGVSVSPTLTVTTCKSGQ